MSVSKPCAGFPSQYEAVRVLLGRGQSKSAIVESTGLDRDRVAALISKVRAKGPAVTLSLSWPDATTDKAKRLVETTLGYIAEALGVPEAELRARVADWCRQPGSLVAPADRNTEPRHGAGAGEEAPVAKDGAASPAQPSTEVDASESGDEDGSAEVSGDGNRDGSGPVDGAAGEGVEPATGEPDAEEAGAAATASQAPPAEAIEADDAQAQADPAAASPADQPAKPEVAPEPSRADDEAELAALAEQPKLFRLADGTGQFLERSGMGMTRNMRKAWQGTAQQIEHIYRRKPAYRLLDAEPVYR